MGVCPWMNATVGPSEARRAKEGASADSAEDKEGYHGCKPVEASFMDIGNLLNWDTDRYCAIVIILFEVYYLLFYIYDSSLA